MGTTTTARTKLTEKVLDKLPVPPEGGKVLLFDAGQVGLGISITPSSRTYFTQRRVNGRQVRAVFRKVGEVPLAQAKREAAALLARMSTGHDPIRTKRAERAAATAKARAGITFQQALEQYVKGKRREKDGLPLKERTKSDYLSTVAPASKSTVPGVLHSIADRPIASISADDIRELFNANEKRGPRAAVYSMQVLRAILNWHGVQVPGNPLGKLVAGRDRIRLRPTVGNPSPIPPERLGAWWRAACAAGTEEVGGTPRAGDYYRFRLLTGCRGVEVLGDAHNEPVRVGDVDVVGARIKLVDTKNRRDHTLLLSTQALAIAERHIEGRKSGEPLFPVGDPRKTLQAINKAAGMAPLDCQGHDLRDTFASIAEDLVSSYTLKRMLNHADTNDVTGGHYIAKSEAQLRAGWQAVADAVEAASKVVPITKGKRKAA